MTIEEINELMAVLAERIKDATVVPEEREQASKMYIELAKAKAELETAEKDKKALNFDRAIAIAGLVLEAIAIVGAIFAEHNGVIVSKLFSKLRFKHI